MDKRSKPVDDIPAGTATVFLMALLLLRVVLGIAYSAFNPLGEAPDEADHYAYAAYIAREGRLPEGVFMTQAKHPPFYYLIAAGVMALADVEPDVTFLRANPDGGVTGDAMAPNFFVHTTLEDWPWRDGVLAMHLGRLISLLASLVVVVGTYLLGRTLWPEQRMGPLTAAAFVAFLPEALFVGGSMSNDMLAAMWSTLALWLGMRHQKQCSQRRAVVETLLAGTCMGLAFLTKASTMGLWPVVVLTILVPPLSSTNSPTGGDQTTKFHRWFDLRARLRHAVLATVIALSIAAPWLIRNWHLYGDPLGMPLVLATIDQRQGPLALTDLWQLLRGWFISFWGKFGGAGHILLPTPFYIVWGGLVAGAVVGWIKGGPSHKPRHQPSLAAWTVLIGAPTMAASAILFYSRVALGTDQGRLLFPSLAPIALLIVGGLTGWLPPNRPWRLISGVTGGGIIIAGWALIAGIILPFGPPPAPTLETWPTTTPVNSLFGDRVQLIAYHWTKNADSDYQLDLLWQATQPLEVDLRTSLRLLDKNGNITWEWKRSPGAGRYSTDRWPPARPVPDMYRVPADLLSQAVRVELGLRPFPEQAWLPALDAPNQGPFLPLMKPQ